MATNKTTDPISGKTDAGRTEEEKAPDTTSTSSETEGTKTVSGKTDAG